MPTKLKHIGIDSFFAERKKLLDAFDQAIQQSSDDEVKTEHGIVGESHVRKWLSSFLPKRFGVCKGYIITTNLEYSGALEEWDVIIYDALESPILFTRASNEQEEKRAIPVEYVRGVIEVKATLTPYNANSIVTKLTKLREFIGENKSLEYPQYLCPPFISSALFFETKVKSFNEYRKSLDNLCVLFREFPELPFLGSLVLRSHKNHEHSGYLKAMYSDAPIGLQEDVFEMSSEFQFPDSNFGLFGAISGYSVNSYSMFVFDLLNALKGKLDKRASSFYGLDFENTQASRLFH